MVLVTGGLGFIGSHTVVEMANAGYRDIVIVDNLSNAKISVLDKTKALCDANIVFYKADICDKDALKKIFSDNEITSVIHFAGLKAVGESVQKPLMYYKNNIEGTLTLCEVMQKYGCNKIVFSSSATVYGTDNKAPYTEDMPTSATNPYGWTKVMQEQMLSDIAAANKGMSVALLRYFNPIGAHESGLIGEDPNGIPNNLMPYICKVAKGILPVLSIYGDDYDTHDGTGVRDYIHVCDLADGHVKTLSFIEKNEGVFAINLGTGTGYSVLDVVNAFECAAGFKINKQIVGRRAGDIATSYASSEKAKTLLGFEAKRTLGDMCRDSWNFASKNF